MVPSKALTLAGRALLLADEVEGVRRAPAGMSRRVSCRFFRVLQVFEPVLDNTVLVLGVGARFSGGGRI
jgi:hypothetical protein